MQAWKVILSRDSANPFKAFPNIGVFTDLIYRSNEGRPLEEVFQVERKAASFMIRHPDYLEGIRAQVLEKDHRPRWYPKTIEEVGDLGKILE